MWWRTYGAISHDLPTSGMVLKDRIPECPIGGLKGGTWGAGILKSPHW